MTEEEVRKFITDNGCMIANGTGHEYVGVKGNRMLFNVPSGTGKIFGCEKPFTDRTRQDATNTVANLLRELAEKFNK